MMFALLGSLALADVVGDFDDDDCPVGSVGFMSHSGNTCRPTRCDEGCAADHVCEPAGLCLFEEERPCGTDLTEDTSCTWTFVDARGACESDADCAGLPCVIEDRCVDPAAKAKAEGGCGCASGSGPAAVLVLGLLPLVWRSRRAQVGRR